MIAQTTISIFMIAAGLFPDGAGAGSDHWAYQPAVEARPPSVMMKAWPRTAVDRFVLSRLEKNGLSPSRDADPGVLLRRLHFHLVGLPPSRDANARFIRRVASVGLDSALSDEVDALLASPGFGENWGRHWLDVARFGESSGGEANISFPYAWRYRDYVIDSINDDMPYNRFLLEQLAGDLLVPQDKADRARLLIATGFLAVGPKNLDEMNPKQFRADTVDEQIDVVSRAVLASSVSCARCHDHKFDPFSMHDYYALAGIFSNTRTFFGTAVSPANRVGGDPLKLPDADGLKAFHRSIPSQRVKSLQTELAALQKEKDDGAAAVRKAVAEGKDPSGLFTLRDALRIFWRSGGIEGQLEKVDDEGRALLLAMGTLDRDRHGDAPLLERGEIARPGEQVPRGFPKLINLGKEHPIPKNQSGRLQLAEWLIDPAHPLTARVIVNRVWHHLFGAGLVRTVDNFGSTGEAPSHPELLDYLAIRFVEQDWSLKELVREILMARTYRQSSDFHKDAFLKDPDNRLLWRIPKRRLSAEAIRDAMLLVSGELRKERPEASLVGRVIGDRPISLIGLDKRVPADLDGATHRSVYLPIIRDRLPDALDLFDFAEPSLVTGHRETTNVPVQALYLLNSTFVQQRAASFAQRLAQDCGDNPSRIDRAFMLCFGRLPYDDERARTLEFLSMSDDQKDDDMSSLSSFCQAMFCTAEFRNLD